MRNEPFGKPYDIDWETDNVPDSGECDQCGEHAWLSENKSGELVCGNCWEDIEEGRLKTDD